MSFAVPIDDRGLLLGDGLFETVLVKDGTAGPMGPAPVPPSIRGCVALGLRWPTRTS